MGIRVNIGCGMAPIEGWHNYDNSWSVCLSKLRLLLPFARKLKLVSPQQAVFISFAAKKGIRYADATKRIPEHSESVDVLYTSHMIEHLDRSEVMDFLAEAKRVIRKCGIIRIAVPNIRYYVDIYTRDGDADHFIESTLLATNKPKGLWQKLKYLLVADRNHRWMYDGESLCRLLISAGFDKPVVLNPGITTIDKPGKLNLAERVPESVFVESVKT